MKRPASSQIESDRRRRERERRCIVSLETLPEAQLIRFALAPDAAVTPDVAANLPGRGAWVRAARASVETAARKGAFARAFKQPARAAPELADQVGVAHHPADLVHVALEPAGDRVARGIVRHRDRLGVRIEARVDQHQPIIELRVRAARERDARCQYEGVPASHEFPPGTFY